jgi:predicted flavoprotein YhiN
MPAAPRQFDVIVLGAGAAGLMCAAVAGQRGRRVVVLEHNGQPGRKILISGGGRCNFTNLHCGPENFLSENPHFAKSALALYRPRHFLELVEKYGIAWHEKTLGQLFCDGPARAIVEMLLAECALGGVEVVLNAREIAVVEGSGEFRVASFACEFRAESLVVATGGLSIPKLGATGLGYELARHFGLKVLEPRPALVPLVLGGGEAGWTELAGVAAEVAAWVEPWRDSAKAAEEQPSGAKQAAEKPLLEPPQASGHDFSRAVSGLESTRALAPEACISGISPQIRPFSAACKAHPRSASSMYGLKPVPFKEKLLVTHSGLSGPAVLQASLYWQEGGKLVVDFAPSIARSHSGRKDKDAATEGRPGIEAGLLQSLMQPGARRDLTALKQALRQVLPLRLANYLAEIGGPDGWSNAALEACERRLHEWEFHPVGTEGFDKAEVTAGGVDTCDLQARTMEARAVPGLFFIGEVVDVTGQLGGFNLQWAWASGVAAGRAC